MSGPSPGWMVDLKPCPTRPTFSEPQGWVVGLTIKLFFLFKVKHTGTRGSAFHPHCPALGSGFRKVLAHSATSRWKHVCGCRREECGNCKSSKIVWICSTKKNTHFQAFLPSTVFPFCENLHRLEALVWSHECSV